MVKKITPKANEVYFIKEYTLFHILEGNGTIEVDFKNYLNWDDKLIFLEKGQYIKFSSDSFVVRKIEFDNEILFQNQDVRILFKHLVSLGYIDYLECKDCQEYLQNTLFTSPKDIIDISINQWYWQNPFNADKKEYQIIFDIKEVIDQEFKNHLSVQELIQKISKNNNNINYLLKNKIGITVKKLETKKRLIEDQKLIAFTDSSIKQIAYEQGYKDVAYFNKNFKKNTGITPSEFRDQIGYQLDDHFENDLFKLIQEYHTSEKKLSFYADQMHISEKTLAQKVRQKLHTSMGQLIRYEIIRTSKEMLLDGEKIKTVAYFLGFDEANHFSSFFKHHTTLTPTQFLKKYNK
ncbi:helix-turn-helix domain-containing protein [Tenacibaculum agarivorans]|uniref:helix-turn-helix domain-containing protein n=1 Tax=Tenacibaculum agarivorans TaxID=1908389 RepID=UPI00094BC494|nr:AraC family transcriptional regulator [Tenacibaculum agarivorans]